MIWDGSAEEKGKKVTCVISVLMIVIAGVIPYIVSNKSSYFDNYPLSTLVTVALICFLNEDGGLGILSMLMHLNVVVATILSVIFAHLLNKKWIILLNLILIVDVFLNLCQLNLLGAMIALGIIVLANLSRRTV